MQQESQMITILMQSVNIAMLRFFVDLRLIADYVFLWWIICAQTYHNKVTISRIKFQLQNCIQTFGLIPDPCLKKVPVINQKLFETLNWFSIKPPLVDELAVLCELFELLWKLRCE